MQRQQLKESIGRAQRDLRESVWRSYKNVILLDKKNELRTVDLGLLNSSQSPSITKLIVDRLRQEGDLELTISPNFLVRNWPPPSRNGRQRMCGIHFLRRLNFLDFSTGKRLGRPSQRASKKE